MIGKDKISLIDKRVFALANGDIFSDSLLLAIVMLFTILFIPIFESIFGLLTKALLELADKEKPLIRRLSLEAPGTFEHTLLICGLAEEATRMIGGDIDLIKLDDIMMLVNYMPLIGLLRIRTVQKSP